MLVMKCESLQKMSLVDGLVIHVVELDVSREQTPVLEANQMELLVMLLPLYLPFHHYSHHHAHDQPSQYHDTDALTYLIPPHRCLHVRCCVLALGHTMSSLQIRGI